MKRLGRILQLWRHPVKGMRGERVAESPLRWAGLAGDRRYAFVRGDDDSRFPWLTGRVHAQLLRYTPRFENPSEPGGSRVRVQTPDGRELPVEDPALLAELAQGYGGPVSFLHSGRGLHDAAQVSLIGLPTLDALCREAGVPTEPRRFRNNLVVEPEPSAAFAEEAWLGKTLQLGEGADAPQLRVDRRNERCIMITLEPQTLERTDELLTALAVEREACVGLYASVVRPGLLREGAAILEL